MRIKLYNRCWKSGIKYFSGKRSGGEEKKEETTRKQGKVQTNFCKAVRGLEGGYGNGNKNESSYIMEQISCND